jgi:hypothetical protein
MTGMRSAVEDTLRLPEVVVQSLGDARARLYYRYHQQTIVSSKYLCVVVVQTPDDAFVVTAYVTDQIKKGDVLWRKGL